MEENRKKHRGCLMEYAVGTILWWRGREIAVVRDPTPSVAHSCMKCVLFGTRTCAYAVECSALKRKDCEGVHFENVRKEERI